MACSIPTAQPESDGTLAWTSTTVALVRVQAGEQWGLGYTFSHASAAALVRETLAPLLLRKDAMSNGALFADMLREVRNVGRSGLAASAISAVDVALWDLKARLLDVPLFQLFGTTRTRVPVYGSGGFTSYDVPTLQRQLAGFVAEGIGRVKMKVGRHPEQDVARVAAAREAIGSNVGLMVDGNGAYDCQGALLAARRFAELGVDWFEEPVSSDDLRGLRRVSAGAPPGVEVTAGEYGYDPFYFRRMLQANAIDVLQADATRCLGYTGFAQVVALCEAFNIPLSAHTAPHLHLPCCCAAQPVRHIEYFHDHVRIEELLLDGARRPERGELCADPSSPGHGMSLKLVDAQRYAVGA